MGKYHRVRTSLGRRLPALSFLLIVGLLLNGVLVWPVQARELGSRLGTSPSAPTPQTVVPVPAPAEATPMEDLILPFTGPLAADGAGRLLIAINEGNGYSVLRRHASNSDKFEIVYRRKASLATSLAVGPDGTFCVGVLSGVDCIDAQGRISHHEHDLLTGIISIAFSPDGHLWILRSSSGGATGLQLVRATPGFRQVQHVLTLRQNIQGFDGNGIAATSDGSVLLPVIENDVYRVLRVQPNGQFIRVEDFWSLGGGIVVDATDTAYLDGVKRPQSLQEQRTPQDVVFAQPAQGTSDFAARFPMTPGDSRRTGHVALGGDGMLYVTRHQRVRVEEGPAQEMPVLWRINLGRPSLLGTKARVIDFRIPFIDSLINPRLSDPEYAGPLLVGRGQPLIIEGLNFEGKQGARQVLVGGMAAPIDVWSEEGIVVRVPQGAPGGETQVHVAIDHVLSDYELIEVKTPDVPGWFQVGSPSMRAALHNNMVFVAYNAQIVIEGTTDRGVKVQRTDSMETPGLFHLRLPNGQYSAKFSAAYVYMESRYSTGNQYVGTFHAPIKVDEQTFSFRITDDNPIVLWMPDMLGLD